MTPFYRLPEVLRDYPQLADAQRLTLRESFGCIHRHLWDEKNRRLVSFAAARDSRHSAKGLARRRRSERAEARRIA